MRRRNMLMNVSDTAPTDADATLWAADVVTNGGTVTPLELAYTSRFITTEKANGTWELTDDYMPLWNKSSISALTSLKQRRLGAVVGTPVFTADRGYTFNGVDNYIATGFIPGTHAVAMTGNNMRGAVYILSEQASTGYAFGALSASLSRLILRPLSSNLMGYGLNGSNVTIAPNPISSKGLRAASRADTVFTGWQNGVSMGTSVPGSTDVVLPTHEMFIGCFNNVGVPASFLAATIGFAAFGAALTPAQELAQRYNIQSWATLIGAQV